MAARLQRSVERRMDPEVFRALADETRLVLVARLATASRPLTVTEASECCGVHLSGVSRHLAILRRAGVVTAEREGREVRYRLDADALLGTLNGLADAIEACRKKGCC